MYEVTIQQYADFLNAVAASDPYQLYNPSMETDLTVAGIARSGNSGAYTYRVIGPSGATPSGASSPGNRPIAYVSWFDAARFANWMHNGKGAGDTENGAYTLNGATSGMAVAANAGAKFHIPTPDEWYKAAYYSPTLNHRKGGYYVFATQSNATPGSVPDNDITKRHRPNQANYFNGGFAVTQAITPSPSQNYLTDVGAFSKSASFYGTFDQAGNVYEWTDGNGSGSQRSLRGAYWVSNVADTSYLDEYILPPDYESSGSGFRLASRQTTSATTSKKDRQRDPLIGRLANGKRGSASIRDWLTHYADSRFQGRARGSQASSRNGALGAAGREGTFTTSNQHLQAAGQTMVGQEEDVSPFATDLPLTAHLLTRSA
jgi:formylglycine-generating enzyme required for sulfatase activity